MGLSLAVMAALLWTVPSTPVSQGGACAAYDGAIVINEDGEYIGRVESNLGTDSIFNRYGSYGSKYSSDSIFNKYGNNGSPYASNSAFNKYSSTPPKMIKSKRVIGYLSINKNLDGAVNPLTLGISCYDYEPQA